MGDRRAMSGTEQARLIEMELVAGARESLLEAGRRFELELSAGDEGLSETHRPRVQQEKLVKELALQGVPRLGVAISICLGAH